MTDSDVQEPTAQPDPPESTGDAAASGVQEPAPQPDPPASTEAAAASGAKADLGKRIVAVIIDSAIAFVIGFIPGIGSLIGAAYMVLRDGMEFDFMNHRSIGKHVMKLHLESVDGSPLDIATSLKRNWMFALAPLVPLLIITIIGWVLVPFVLFAALALMVTELVLVLTNAEGRRLGDKIAGTKILED